MDIFDEDLLLFWKSLSDSGVMYLMVGGFAVTMHGYIRATEDIVYGSKMILKTGRSLAER
ncbi:MAG: hypothetical protein IPP72_04540 [Chitinophagaceae bacterium]|nr:hypothetical protein [Chitinophagaceae bacterium]